MAEYLLVIDLDEIFVPRGNNWNFLDVLKSIEATEAITDMAEKGGLNGAILNKGGDKAKHIHPACYITVLSDVVVNPYIGGYTDAERPWTGQR